MNDEVVSLFSPSKKKQNKTKQNKHNNKTNTRNYLCFQVLLNRQRFPRASPSSVKLLFPLPRVFIGLILLVGSKPTLSKLTVTWKLMEEAGR